MKFATIKESHEKPLEHITMNNWIIERNNFVTVKNLVPQPWEKTAIFMMECFELETPQARPMKFTTVVGLIRSTCGIKITNHHQYLVFFMSPLMLRVDLF